MLKKIKTFDNQYVKTTVENKPIWNVCELILWKLGEIILPNILEPYLGLLKMKTNNIKKPWECGIKGSLMNLQLDEDLMKRNRVLKCEKDKRIDGWCWSFLFFNGCG